MANFGAGDGPGGMSGGYGASGFGGGFGGDGGGYGGYGSDSGPNSAYGGANTGPSAGPGLGNTIGGGWGGYGADDGAYSAYGGEMTGPSAGAGFGFGMNDAFGLDTNTQLSNMFAETPPAYAETALVDQMTPEERAKKMALSVGMPMAMSALGPVGGLLGPAVGSLTGAVSDNQAAKMGISGIMSGIGTALGGPLGGLLGSIGARALGNPTGPAPNRPGTGGMDFGALASGLGGLYMANRGARDQRNAANTAQQISAGQTQQLQDMFGPNSAAANQLRQQLNRRDAASGRRSQYGPREVELQAKLAQMQAQYAPSLMNASTAANKQAMDAQAARRTREAQLYSTLDRMLNTSGGYKAIQKGLGNLFGGNQGGFDRGYIDPTTFYG